jgi:large subunit ribosomal protein L4
MKTPIYNIEGKEINKIDLPEQIFELPWNADLVHQVVTTMATNARQPIAHTKNRGEVRGGGKKPWKQKGTGRARHGSRRSPIWIGGGVTFGPRNEKDYSRKINKKMKAKALAIILSKKLKDNEIIFVDSLNLSKPKTAEAKNRIVSLATVSGFEKLATKRKNTALISLAAKDNNVKKSFANFSNFLTEEARNINPIDLMNYKYVVFENPEETIKVLTERINIDKK